jgi:hypothetical protein
MITTSGLTVCSINEQVYCNTRQMIIQRGDGGTLPIAAAYTVCDDRFLSLSVEMLRVGLYRQPATEFAVDEFTRCTVPYPVHAHDIRHNKFDEADEFNRSAVKQLTGCQS